MPSYRSGTRLQCNSIPSLRSTRDLGLNHSHHVTPRRASPTTRLETMFKELVDPDGTKLQIPVGLRSRNYSSWVPEVSGLVQPIQHTHTTHTHTHNSSVNHQACIFLIPSVYGQVHFHTTMENVYFNQSMNAVSKLTTDCCQ
ncbi:hypothetical protein FF38_12631 [Lucilia cuprina]|uniref:Uncharacterized protein n=1 Tax=Lucilia cuprina TaxID=7375 RepID=A0A0L0C4H2_LUCCU|nr:hypothetical protein FF38_12631 [Lucilia cuprina]